MFNIVERNKALFLYKNHFCLIWKCGNVSFNQANKELGDKFKLTDNYVTEENVNSHFEHIYKFETHSTNFITYDLETRNTDRARPYAFSFKRLSKLTGKYTRDLRPYEIDKCKNDTFLFDGDNCVSIVLDFC